MTTATLPLPARALAAGEGRTLSILGATPYVVPVVVVALGLLGGGVVGAVCGFFAGLLMDSLLLQTLGVSSLVLLSIGYLAGRYRRMVSSRRTRIWTATCMGRPGCPILRAGRDPPAEWEVSAARGASV